MCTLPTPARHFAAWARPYLASRVAKLQARAPCCTACITAMLVVLVDAFVGHLPECIGPKNPWTYLKWANAYVSIYKVQFMDNFTVILTDYDSITQVTRKTSECRARLPTKA